MNGRQRPTFAQCIGEDESLLVACDDHTVHRDALGPLRALQASAAAAGFDLVLASAYRSYQQQLCIWNEKASGQRPVLDDAGALVPIQDLDEQARLFAILRYSALPGASRHHWGTDFDIFDRAAVGAGYSVQLIETEVEGDGPFRPMHDWLDEQIIADKSESFARPFRGQTSLAAERWHISHLPTAEQFVDAVQPAQLYQHYEQSGSLSLRKAVLDNFDVIYRDYICC